MERVALTNARSAPIAINLSNEHGGVPGAYRTPDHGSNHTPAPLGLEDVLDGLTEAQRKAASHTEGALLVLAGPGSGKTRVITRRIAYLVACGIPPWQILAVTFTNKAAAEMRERVGHTLGVGAIARGLTVTTFHALCARLLRRYADVAKTPGLTGTFAIYDSDDQIALVKKALEALNLSTTNWPPRSVLSKISAAKNDLLDVRAFDTQALDFSAKTVAKIYSEYQKSLRAANAVDFDDLLLITAQMLRTNAQVRGELQHRWRYLLVDEYQDTNKAQFVIASLIAGAGEATGQQAHPQADQAASQNADERAPSGPNICVVGDPDQSIYGWRGADITNILQFEQNFPNAQVIALGENFRSTGHIILAADALIRSNTQRKHKDLFTSNKPGHKVEIVLTRDEHHEARLVADWIRRLKDESSESASDASSVRGMGPTGPLAWKDFAVFYRTNALSRVIEDALRSDGVPYVIARGTTFYQREEIKNAVSYLRVVANPADGVSLERIVNTPARGIGDTTLERVQSLAAQRGTTLLEALRGSASALQLATRTGASIAKFVQMVDGWAGIHDESMLTRAADEGSLAELVERVIRESGLEEMYRKQSEDSEVDRLANLEELVSSAREFEETYDPSSDPGADAPLDPSIPPEPPSLLQLLRAYLERITLVADADAIDPANGAVTLMSLHAAKGLEFRAVAMIGLEEGVLPHSRVQEMPEQLEEERRLCFVGITRAMQRLVMTSARYRTIRGIPERTLPSRFLSELPTEHATTSDQAGGGFDDGHSQWDDAGGDGVNFVGRGRSDAMPGRARSSGGFTTAGHAKDIHGKPLVVGAKVRHPQFGVGTIAGITSGRDARAQIQFRQAGTKTLVLQYARLERVEG